MVENTRNRVGVVVAKYAVLSLALISANAFAGSVTLTLVDQATGDPLEGVVVIVEDDTPPTTTTGEMVQQNRAFDPHVLVVGQGSDVLFPNRDNTQHHVYSFSAPKPFNIELYAGQPRAPIRFDKAGIVELGCNIHDQMQAYIVIADSGQVARSGAGGIVQFDVPERALASDQSLKLKVWHPRLPDNSAAKTVMISGPIPIQQTLTLDVVPERTTSNGLDGLQKRFRDL